jgi:hypothetical protein
MTTAETSRRWLWRAVVAALAISLAYALSIGGNAPASAATRGPDENLGNFKVTYNKSWTFKSKPLGICVIFDVRGNFTYHVTKGVAGTKAFEDTWSSQHLNDATLEANIHDYARGSCIGPATATSMDMSQQWTGYSCSFNPSLSISVPWAVSVGFWPSCGDRNLAKHHTSYSDDSSYYIQYNTGDKLRIGNYSSAYPPGGHPSPPCYGVYVEGTPHEQMLSDSYVSGAKEVCLSKY